MRRAVRFLLDDKLHELTGFEPTTTLLDWLRLSERRTGVKEGCAEGDCGACTVAVGRPVAGGVDYRAINACIRPLATLDGCQVLTVESLLSEGALHPIQQALVDHHGSQCGFCTPGIVMSLHALSSLDEQKTPARIDDALAGNLCRCTGYRPIVDAALEAFAKPIAKPADKIASQLEALQDRETIFIESGSNKFWAPATSDELARLVEEHPDAVLIAGATDVGLWITKELRLPPEIIYLGRVAELRGVSGDGSKLVIGAMTELTQARIALASIHPQIDELMRRFGSEQIRNSGTIGGNIANGSPIGDLPPVLIALGASIVLRKGAARRELPLEKFFLDYRKQDRLPGEFVEKIVLPALPADALFHVSKVSKRFDEDISAVCGAFFIRLDTSGVVLEARLAYGGMAGIPKRAAQAEAALISKLWTPATADAAAASLAKDFTPLDDWRASARYRSIVAANLLRRFSIETATPASPTRVAGLLRNFADA